VIASIFGVCSATMCLNIYRHTNQSGLAQPNPSLQDKGKVKVGTGEVSRFSVYMHGGPPYGRCIIDDPYCCIGLDLKEFILRAGPLQRVILSVERAGKPNLLLDPKNGAVGLQS
jgi:hypothetical protein